VVHRISVGRDSSTGQPGRVRRAAAIYDIHGNLPALEAVLEEIGRAGVDRVMVGGDVVPGPMPRETLAALRGLAVPVQCIHGNGESAVLAQQRGEALTRVPERIHGVIRWVTDELRADDLAELASWPLTADLEIEGVGRVQFCHATPRDDNELFTRITPEDRLRPMFEATGAGLIVCGHTHMQFDRMIGRTRVVNAGSVGLPFGDPGAYWLLLGPGVELRRTRYDLAAATRRIRATTYPQALEFEIQTPPAEAQMLEAFERSALR